MDNLGNVVGAALIFFVVAGVLIGSAGAAGTFAGLFAPADETDLPSYDIDGVYVDPIEAEGQVDVSPPGPLDPGTSGIVLIDRAHSNHFDRAEIDGLTAALIGYGHEVRTVDDVEDFDRELADADALIVIDPGRAYSNESASAVADFIVEDDGRVLLLGEPDQMELGDLGAQAVDREINSLAHRLGISFGSDHVYDMQEHDGNHRNVLVTPSDHEMMAGIDRAVVYIGTRVTAADGDVLLQTSPGAQRSASETTGAYPVAVKNGSVVAIGDSSFIGQRTFNVADNEVFIEAIVEFLGGEYD